MPTTCVFATATELPTLTDAGFAALQEGKDNAVLAIARAMQRQNAQNALLEAIFGGAS